MPATLYLRPSPRAYFLLTETHALIFRQPDASETKASRSVVVAEFLPIEAIDTRGLVKAGRAGMGVEGVLGVTSVPSERSPVPEIFLLLVTSASPLSPLLPGSPLYPSRIVSVEFHSLSSSFWDTGDLAAAPGAYGGRERTPWDGSDADVDDPYGPSWASSSGYHTPTQSQASAQGVEHPCLGMKKYLESGGFFYASNAAWDISTRMGEDNWVAEDAEVGARRALEDFDERFVWNASLLAPLLAFRKGLAPEKRQELDMQALLIPVIQGFVGSAPIPLPPSAGLGQREPRLGVLRPNVGSLGMISRLSWKRAGARFRTRGIDDDGQVANFVETEVILCTGGQGAGTGEKEQVYSWVVIRGSVPLFWQQPSQGLQTLQQKVEITRPPQASQPAFDKHFLELLYHYHSVHAVNLLGQKDAESMLSAAYDSHLANLQRSLQDTAAEDLEKEHLASDTASGSTDVQVELTPYDFHQVVKMQGHEAVRYDMGTRIRDVVRSRKRFGWTAVERDTGRMVKVQQGTYRVNCLDWTNYVQDVLSSLALADFLASIQSPLLDNPSFWAAHRELWADNGDRLSKTYAGTGALNTSATRSGKKTFAGLLSDATKSVGRAYINNFQDKGKQAAIDMLLGMMAGQRPVILYDPIADTVQSALTARVNEYSQTRKLKFWIGTWNLNGTPPGEGLGPWMFPNGKAEADVYMVAFQEIVQLTAGQILQTDPAKRRMWEQYLVDTFASQTGSTSEYILYRSEQLVGTALIIIVKSSLTSAIRNVESATKKTGLQGLSGNKGGVGIRFNLYDSSICLMTCHLAAGHSNVNERNADYKTVLGGLKFLRGKSIEDHDLVVWAADFNYRIAMSNEEVRPLAESGHIDPLLAADQLMQAIDEGEVFQDYTEGAIAFLPTYKFDNNSDTYDTSEKARIPAWTDRVLFRGPASLKAYDRAELRSSDHRPVYAVLDVEVREVDQGRKARITREISGGLQGEIGGLSHFDGGSQASEKAVSGGKAALGKAQTGHNRPAPPVPNGTKVLIPGLFPDGPAERVAPPPMPSRLGAGATASKPPRPVQRSLLDEDDDDMVTPLPTAMPILPSRPSASSITSVESFTRSKSAGPPRLPERQLSTSTASPAGTNASAAGSGPPPLPTRQGSALTAGTTNDGPVLNARPPVLPARKPSVDSVSDTSVSRPGRTAAPAAPAVPRRPANMSSPTKSSPTPISPVEAQRKAGSVLGAIAAFEAAAKPSSALGVSRTTAGDRSSVSGISPPQQPKSRRKPAPQLSDLLERDTAPSTTVPGAAQHEGQKASERDGEITPTATGDFVLVSAPGTTVSVPQAMKMEDRMGELSISPGKSKKGPPPVSKKPENLRAVSTEAVKRA